MLLTLGQKVETCSNHYLPSVSLELYCLVGGMEAQHRHLNSGVCNRSCAQQQSYRNGEEWKQMSRRITVMDSQTDGISSKP